MAVTDQDVVRQLRGTPPRPEGSAGLDTYSICVLGVSAEQVELELRQSGESARVLVPLPSSGRPQPWLSHSAPDNAAGWVEEFLLWLDEEMFSGGLGPHYATKAIDGINRLVIEGYGFRLSDVTRHRHLLDAAGPDGSWDGSGLLRKARRMLSRWRQPNNQ
jgi:hypothetical protein